MELLLKVEVLHLDHIRLCNAIDFISDFDVLLGNKFFDFFLFRLLLGLLVFSLLLFLHVLGRLLDEGLDQVDEALILVDHVRVQHLRLHLARDYVLLLEVKWLAGHLEVFHQQLEILGSVRYGFSR